MASWPSDAAAATIGDAIGAVGRVLHRLETVTQQVGHDPACSEVLDPQEWTNPAPRGGGEEWGDRRICIEALVDLVPYGEVVESFGNDVAMALIGHRHRGITKWTVE